jgi:hypothetical protein
MTTTEGKAETDNWSAESLRLTAFLAPSAEVKAEGWWAATAGSEPESRTVKPSRGELVETGSYLENSLTLSVQPGRIDWVLAPSQAQFENFEIELKLVGRFPEVADAFGHAMSAWLKNCPPVVRLAYGLVLLERVDTKEEGYHQLSKYLHSIKIDADSQDLFYQVNRPKLLSAGKENLKFNRLSKWSVMAFQPVRLGFGVGSPPTVGPATIFAPPDSTVYACRLELDLSTPGDRQNELAHDELRTIFAQLIAIGSEIANRGDVT